LPHEISSKIVGEVSFPVYAQIQTNLQKSSNAFKAIYTGMMAILVPLYTLLITLAPTLVDDVLGSRWVGTAPVIRILALAGLFGLFGDAVIPLLKGAGQPYKVAALEAVQSILIIALVQWLATNYGLIGAAFAWLPAIASSQILAGIFLARILDRPFASLTRPMLSIIIASGLGALVGLTVDEFISGLFGFILSASLGFVTLAFVLWMLDRLLKLRMAQIFYTAFPQIAKVRQYLTTGQPRV
jgi:O-antigen/teichoic acid export membrane protein